MSKTVWETLSRIDVNEHTNQKGRFTYLSWTWAWSTLQENYPDSTYKFKDILWMPNETCEVWVDLQVEGVTREMWLAVTDHTNKPVANPSSDLISNARMRCLVKAIAMFGLGHYIYAGESLPMEIESTVNLNNAAQSALDAALDRNMDSITAIKESLASNEYETAFEAWHEVTNDDKQALWVAPSKFENAPFTTAERKAMQSSEWTEARHNYLGESV